MGDPWPGGDRLPCKESNSALDSLVTWIGADHVVRRADEPPRLEHAARQAAKAREIAKLEYENEVQKWLDLIRGAFLPTSVDNLKLGAQMPPMPFSDARLLGVLSHSFWF